MKSKIKKTPLIVNSISELHRGLGLPKPLHPLISLVDYSKVKIDQSVWTEGIVFSFYNIIFNEIAICNLKYGQTYCDFDDAGIFFTSPQQILMSTETAEVNTGIALHIHPDFLYNYPLSSGIRNYGFLSYSVCEALHLSDKEKETIIAVFKSIDEELQGRIDDFSQDVVISQIELLLNYSNRFYKRQFITRKPINNDLLEKFETLLNNYFNNESALLKGLPTVQLLAGNLNISPRYLSDMLRSLTKQNAQQYIHNKLIEKAKEKLSTTNLSVSEIAYELGFEHPQSFSKLFKSKSGMSPLAFRISFN